MKRYLIFCMFFTTTVLSARPLLPDSVILRGFYNTGRMDGYFRFPKAGNREVPP
jgi:hypothetical protein